MPKQCLLIGYHFSEEKNDYDRIEEKLSHRRALNIGRDQLAFRHWESFEIIWDDLQPPNLTRTVTEHYQQEI